MSRVLTFSRVFPSYHPKAGQPTYFVEKVLWSLHALHIPFHHWKKKVPLDFLKSTSVEKFDPKFHTIRAGHRWKAGDMFSPRVWSGKPYNSKQIQFAPDIEIRKVWNFDVLGNVEPFYLGVRLDDVLLHEVQCFQSFMGGTPKLQTIAANDGLEWEDFQDWFKFGENINFKGQIICWSENISY